MTDRYSGFIVTLEENRRSDDAEATVNAIQQIKGVLSVTPVVADAGHHNAVAQARSQLYQQIFDLFKKQTP